MVIDQMESQAEEAFENINETLLSIERLFFTAVPLLGISSSENLMVSLTLTRVGFSCSSMALV
jgi:hypothetical protein